MTANWKHLFIGCALFAMAVPVWAHTDSVTYVTLQPTTIAGHRLAPGNYTLRASDTTNKVVVEQNGSTIATVPCQWIQLPQKADISEVMTNNSKVTELEFSGKTEAATFAR